MHFVIVVEEMKHGEAMLNEVANKLEKEFKEYNKKLIEAYDKRKTCETTIIDQASWKLFIHEYHKRQEKNRKKEKERNAENYRL